jgi:predicted nucleotidyltransferase
MLEELFSSKARVEILRLFLFNPEDNFYQRQIALLTHQPIRAVQREVIRLEKIGFIEKSEQGNRIYYKTNRAFPIWEELKRIIFKTGAIKEALKEYLLKLGNIKFAFIYGSYAKGNESLSSDIDLLVIGNISLRELSRILAQPKKELNREINYAIFSLDEFKNKVMQRDSFLNRVLKDKKIFILGCEDELKRTLGAK